MFGRGTGRRTSDGTGRGQGPGRKGGGAAAGPGGECVCPSCGHREEHVRAMPCYLKKCPECGARMVRE